MSKLLFAAILVFATGCHLGINPAIDKELELKNKEVDWYASYTRQANLFNLTSDKCIIEMTSLKYEPVESGPVCRETCSQLAAVNTMARSAPAYVSNLKQYDLGDSEMCTPMGRKKRSKP